MPRDVGYEVAQTREGACGVRIGHGLQMRVILSDCELSHMDENVLDYGAPEVRLMLLAMVKDLSHRIEDVLLDH